MLKRKNTLKVNIFFRRCILVLMLILTSLIFVMSCFHIENQKQFLPDFKGSAIICIVPGVIIFSFVLLLIYEWIDRMQKENEKKIEYMIWSIVILIQAIFLYFLIRDGFKGITDTSQVVNEAIAMVETQNGLINNEAVYFGRYGNNYPFTILIFYICKVIHSMGFQCYTSVLMIINVLLIDISAVFAFKLIQLLKGKTWGIKFLVLFSFSPTTYIWFIFTYTNTFSMPFIMGSLYFGIKAMRRKEHWITNIVSASILGSIGYQIRATTIIPFIAIVLGIGFTLRIKGKREKILGLLIMVSVFAGFMLLSSIICRQHLKNISEDRTFPFTHWIMMGVNENSGGFVNSRDVQFSMSLPTKEEKLKGNLGRIRKRISNMGCSRYAVLLMKKMESVWGLGTDGNPGFYINGENFSSFYRYIYGDRNGFFSICCQIFRSTSFLFVVISCFFQIKKKGVEEFFVISLTLFGAIMFFLLWEANKKYNICFMNLLYLLMSDGISRFYRLVEYDRKKRKSSNVSWHRRVRYLLIFVPALVITIFMISFRQFFIYDYNDYRKVIIEDVCNKEEYISLKNKGDVVEQTFVTGKSFNEFRILYKNSTKLNAGDYWIELLDEKDNIIVVKTLPKIKKGTKRWFDFDLDDIPSSGDKQQYKIRILCMKNQNKGIQLAVTPHDSYDFYSSGKLMLNSKSHKRDLAFCVSQKVKCGRLGKSAYIVLLILVWILSGIFFLWENSGKRN